MNAYRYNNAYLKAAVDTLTTGKLDATTDTWHAATLINGWTNANSGSNPLKYKLDSEGRLQLKGYIAGTQGTVCTQLPAGYRPSTGFGITYVTCGTQGLSNSTFFSIDTTGNILITATGSTSSFAYFNHILNLQA
jgi:hypothetical protein